MSKKPNNRLAPITCTSYIFRRRGRGKPKRRRIYFVEHGADGTATEVQVDVVRLWRPIAVHIEMSCRTGAVSGCRVSPADAQLLAGSQWTTISDDAVRPCGLVVLGARTRTNTRDEQLHVVDVALQGACRKARRVGVRV